MAVCVNRGPLISIHGVEPRTRRPRSVMLRDAVNFDVLRDSDLVSIKVLNTRFACTC